MYTRFGLVIRFTAMLITGFMLSANSYAKGLDGNGKLLCATYRVVACANNEIVCTQGPIKSFDLPQFVFIDFKDKTVRATQDNESKIVSAIKNMEITDAQLIVQGIENHHGWSVSINRESSNMTIASSGPEVSFTIFGSCINN